MKELVNTNTQAFSLSVANAIAGLGYRVQDLFYNATTRSYVLIVDLKSKSILTKKELDTLVDKLKEGAPVIEDVSFDFSMVRRTGGYPSLLLYTPGWH